MSSLSAFLFILQDVIPLLELLSDEKTWERFYEYKSSLALEKQFMKELRVFIDNKEYLSVCENIKSGSPFPLASRSVISKLGTTKKRVVYTYPDKENTVLKLLTYLLLRKYDGVFSPDLFSFRPGKTAKDAVRWILGIPDIESMYSYKADVSNYFNSVNVKYFLPILKETLGDDRELYEFLSGLLIEKRVYEKGDIIEEEKGIMAGTPLSAFYANIYLKDIDRYFYERRIPYARYSDDIILFSKSASELEQHIAYVHSALDAKGLFLNSDKEVFTGKGESWTFLGFICKGKTVDISPVSVTKLKSKMRRKRDALMRWKKRNGYDGVKAAKAFIRIFNRKLFECPADNELSWSRWFFPVINTSKSLHEIDLYAQDCVRYLISGRHTKSRFNVRYGDLKTLGYRALVNEFYKIK